MDPLNYTIQTANPFDSVIKGYQAGLGITQAQQMQAAQQQALQIQQQKADVIRSLVSNPNPTADDYARATLIVPELHEQFKQSWATRNDAQNQSHLNDLTQWSAAIQNGQPQIAVDAMNARAKALEDTAGGPTRESQALKANAQVVQDHPDFANNAIIKPMIFAHPDGKKVVESIAAMNTDKRAEQLQPGLVDKGIADASKSQADAVKANAEAQVAQGTVPALTEKPALDNRLAELDRQIASANSETERGKLQMERDKMALEQKRLGQTQGQAVQDSMDSSLAALQTVNEIKNHPGLRDNLLQMIPGVPGSKPGDVWGSVFKHMPGSDRQALETYVDSLKSQLAFSNLLAAKQSSPTGASGFGALSEGELKLLSNVVANLDTSSSSFPKQLAKVEQFLNKTQAKGLANPNIPTAGGAFIIQHPTYGTVREGDINRLLQQHPGATRQQVIDYLNQTGGK